MTQTTARLARNISTLYIRDQLNAVLKALAAESDPEKRLLLKAQAERYEQLLKPAKPAAVD